MNKNRKTSIFLSSENGTVNGIFFEEKFYTGDSWTRKRISREKVFISLKELNKINKLIIK